MFEPAMEEEKRCGDTRKSAVIQEQWFPFPSAFGGASDGASQFSLFCFVCLLTYLFEIYHDSCVFFCCLVWLF